MRPWILIIPSSPVTSATDRGPEPLGLIHTYEGEVVASQEAERLLQIVTRLAWNDSETRRIRGTGKVLRLALFYVIEALPVEA